MGESGRMKVKLLFLALDGLDGKLAQERDTPILDEMGTYGAMESLPAGPEGIPHTGPCFASIYTGQPPEVHGITSGGWTHGRLWFNAIKVPTIWDQLHSIGMFNLPLTWPPRKVDGWMVSGFPCLEDRAMTYPPSIRRLLPPGMEYVSDVEGKGEVRDAFRKGSPTYGQLPASRIYRFTREIAKTRLKYYRRIFREYPVEIAALGYTFPDRLGHSGHYDLTWKLLDEILWDIRGAFDWKWIVACSDHGFREGKHSLDAFYLTNFDARPKTIMDIYGLLKEKGC